MFRTVVSAAILAVATQASVFAQAFSEPGLAAFDAALQTRVDNGVRAGYAAILIRNGETHIATAGYADIADQQIMDADTPVRIASMSKPVNALAVMMLAEAGALALDDPLSDYVPEFGMTQVAVSPMNDADGALATVPANRPITIRDLLTHTSGVGYIFDYQTDLGRAMAAGTLYQGEGDLEAKIASLASFPLYFQPGERWFYSYSNDILGRVVEVASDMAYEDYLEDRIFAPLGMTETAFFPDEAYIARMAELYVHGPDGALYPAFNAENPEYQPTWASGGGGLASTANDYARFAMMLLNRGELDGVRLVSESGFAQMVTPQVAPDQLPASMTGLSYGYGFGIVMPGTDDRPALGVPGDFGWGGAFDTDFFVSPATGLVAIMMTQTIPGENTPDGRTTAWFRPAAYGTLPQ